MRVGVLNSRRPHRVGKLKRFQAKHALGLDPIRGWTPVRAKKTRQIKNQEPRFDSIEMGLLRNVVAGILREGGAPVREERRWRKRRRKLELATSVRQRIGPKLDVHGARP